MGKLVASINIGNSETHTYTEEHKTMHVNTDIIQFHEPEQIRNQICILWHNTDIQIMPHNTAMIYIMPNHCMTWENVRPSIIIWTTTHPLDLLGKESHTSSTILRSSSISYRGWGCLGISHPKLTFSPSPLPFLLSSPPPPKLYRIRHKLHNNTLPPQWYQAPSLSYLKNCDSVWKQTTMDCTVTIISFNIEMCTQLHCTSRPVPNTGFYYTISVMYRNRGSLTFNKL